jgi:lipopolysaccharide transport system permease protein
MEKSKVIIEASNSSFFPNLMELVRYKDLFITLTWRDFRVRYAQTTIGFLWAIIQPLVSLVILSLVFGKFVGVKTEIPHLLYTVSGLSIWGYFSFVMTNSGNSIINNQNMIKKIYFPRLIIPLSKAVVGLIDFAISFFIMILLMFYYQIVPSVNIWIAPFFVLMGIIASLSVGIWLSALTVRFRDFQFIVPFMVQLGMYITPIAYPAEFAIQKLPNWASTIYFLNPMSGVIEGFRWAVFGGLPPNHYTFISFGVIFILFISGIMYFKKVEEVMADYV